MKTIIGNLITLANQGEFDVIIHGCNCFNNMGAGIAKEIKLKFPQAWMVDQGTIKGNRKKLGNITFANSGAVTVVNAYTQYKYGRNECNADYQAIRQCFKKVKEKFSGKRIGFPMIGAGLAGGDWSVISKIIDEELEGEDFTLVKLR
jgi:O-acetyl-ADP-ribose deacetylase (regulator of RNase III)